MEYCGRCKGMMKAVTGLLILMNFFLWPKWTGIDGWLVFFGVLMVIGGAIKAIKPCCNCPGSCCGSSCCGSSCETPAPEKKKKKS